MRRSTKSQLNAVKRNNISRKIHLSNDEIVCGQKTPCLANGLDEWLTKGELRCQKCLRKYQSENN